MEKSKLSKELQIQFTSHFQLWKEIMTNKKWWNRWLKTCSMF